MLRFLTKQGRNQIKQEKKAQERCNVLIYVKAYNKLMQICLSNPTDPKDIGDKAIILNKAEELAYNKLCALPQNNPERYYGLGVKQALKDYRAGETFLFDLDNFDPDSFIINGKVS